jgi:predicted deacylase
LFIPGVNAYSIQNDQRRFIDDEDLNRAFPGKTDGNRVNNTLIKLMKNTTVIQYS